jgi:sugar phosphate isomerase/epimerase
MIRPIHRRRFLGTAAAAGAGLSLAGLATRNAAAEAVQVSSPTAEKLGWRLAGQLYTFRAFPFYEALDMIAGLGIKYVEPCFFLRLCEDRPGLKTDASLSPEVRKELKAKLDDRGMKMANFYARLGPDEADCRRQFDFAREMGVETFVSEPPAEALDLIEGLCDEYEINLAVHNHPQSPKSKYWKPENVLAVCEGRSKRIGACCDTGHWIRSNLNPVECLKKMEGRIISLHLKETAEWGVPKARDVPLGTGVGNYKEVLKEVHRQGFQGVMSIEYEHQSPQLTEEVAACVAFVEKTAKSL